MAEDSNKYTNKNCNGNSQGRIRGVLQGNIVPNNSQAIGDLLPLPLQKNKINKPPPGSTEEQYGF